jgi:Uma2 family endonuclease
MSRHEAKAAEPRPRLWSREEYHRLSELGWFRETPVQRIRGEIVEMSPQKGPHATAIGCVAEELRAIFGPGTHVREQKPLELGAHSDPEPDVAVVRGGLRDYVERHPDNALLVVEVADTSLSFDLGEKALLYAESGIEGYWVVDLVHRKLVVHRLPAPHGYRDIISLGPGDAVSPLAAAASTLPVARLLP